ncbi:MAG: cation:proton antiporter [Microthrixaceae bacterium]
MDGVTVFVIGAVVVLFAAIARRIDSTPLSGPMVFVAAGLLLGGSGLGWLQLELSSSAIRTLVEATLAIVLFSDASRVDLSNLRHHLALPGRLLGVGLPLCVGFGVLAALVVLRDLPWEAALLVGIMLAPTDAALGQAVVTDRSVPVYVRQGLNVESGLNDGIVFPVFEVAITAALVGIDGIAAGEAATTLLREIGLGALAGALVGAAAGPLLSWARRSSWTGRPWHGIATLGITATAYGLALVVGGNGFIAAFAAGIAYRPSVGLPTADDVSHDAAELLTMLAFLVFGAVVLGPDLGVFDWSMLLCGRQPHGRQDGSGRTGAAAQRRAGPHDRVHRLVRPQGIASVLYSFLLLEATEGLAVYDRVVSVVTLTVALSVLLHGMTAAPLAAAYGRWYASMSREHSAMPESTRVFEHHLGRSHEEEDRP